MFRPSRLAGAVLALLSGLVAASPQAGSGLVFFDKAPGKQADRPPSTQLPAVVVTAGLRRSDILDAPAAISVLTAQDIRDAGPGVQLSEALPRLPGVWVADRGNAAQDLQISVRGFGARASFGVRGLRVLVDGIPATAPDGSGSVSGVALDLAERIEWQRGPFSALQGTHSGGTLAVQTRAPRGGALQGRWDAWWSDTPQRHVAVTLEGGAVSAPWRLWASHWDSAGWRPQAQARRQLLHARWDLAPGWSVMAQWQHQPAQDPLGLSRAQWQTAPDSSTEEAQRFDTRKQLDHQLIGLRGELGPWQLRAWVQQRQVWQWQAIPLAAQAAPSHPGGVIDLQREHWGLSLQREEGRWVIGLLLDTQDETRRGYENFQGSGPALQQGVTGRLRRDDHQVLNLAEVYAQGRWPLGAQLVLHSGLRVGVQTLRSTDAYLSNGDDSGRLRRHLALPTVGLQGQLSARSSWFISTGAARETPTLNEMAYRPEGAAGLNTALRSQQALQAELGLRHRQGAAEVAVPSIQWEATVFTARTRDEIVSARQLGGRTALTNAGQTQRQGVELQLQGAVAGAWQGLLSATWLQATVRQPYTVCERTPCSVAQSVVPAGARLPGVPERSLRLDLSSPMHALGAGEAGPPRHGQGQWGLSLSARSRMWVNDRNTEAAPGHALLAAWWRWQPQPRTSLTLRVDNLLDRRHIASVIVNESNGRFFEPGPVLSWSLQARHQFGPGA